MDENGIHQFDRLNRLLNNYKVRTNTDKGIHQPERFNSPLNGWKVRANSMDNGQKKTFYFESTAKSIALKCTIRAGDRYWS